jgi:hypothetical protein
MSSVPMICPPIPCLFPPDNALHLDFPDEEICIKEVSPRENRRISDFEMRNEEMNYGEDAVLRCRATRP